MKIIVNISYALFRQYEFFDARKELRAIGEEDEKEEAAAKKEIVKKWKRERGWRRWSWSWLREWSCLSSGRRRRSRRKRTSKWTVEPHHWSHLEVCSSFTISLTWYNHIGTISSGLCVLCSSMVYHLLLHA